jgi:hypothetical protein
MEDGTGHWRKLHNKALYNLCSSLNIIRVIKTKEGKTDETYSKVWDIRNVYNILIGNA